LAPLPPEGGSEALKPGEYYFNRGIGKIIFILRCPPGWWGREIIGPLKGVLKH